MDIDKYGRVYSSEDNFRVAPQRQLCCIEHDRIDLVKNAAIALQDIILAQVPAGRERSMAITHLEDAITRAIRGITE